MTISRSELKLAAKKQIKGNVAVYFGLSLLWGLIISVSSLTFVGPLILMGPATLGLTLFILEVVRSGSGKLETGFSSFKQFGVSFLAGLLITLFTLLWSLLFIIPGVIASFRYSMAYYIIADNPEMSAMQAISKSKEMMKGHKWELFVLLFSFFWWYLLIVVTFGFAAIYVTPYIEATVTGFYEKLKAENN